MIYYVYGKEGCPLCIQALRKLIEFDLECRFRHVDTEKAKELLERYPMFYSKTYIDDIALPIILADGELIGGYVQMMEHIARHRVDPPVTSE